MTRVQCDEIWSFTPAKQKAPVHGAGDTWTWTGIEAQSKLIISWMVDGRDGAYALAFMDDLRGRPANGVQLTTNGHKAHLCRRGGLWGRHGLSHVGKALRWAPESAKGRYSPAECNGARKEIIGGSPDPRHASTSYPEYQNLTMRTHMRRSTRPTNAFSKKWENHVHMVALYTVW